MIEKIQPAVELHKKTKMLLPGALAKSLPATMDEEFLYHQYTEDDASIYDEEEYDERTMCLKLVPVHKWLFSKSSRWREQRTKKTEFIQAMESSLSLMDPLNYRPGSFNFLNDSCWFVPESSLNRTSQKRPSEKKKKKEGRHIKVLPSYNSLATNERRNKNLKINERIETQLKPLLQPKLEPQAELQPELQPERQPESQPTLKQEPQPEPYLQPQPKLESELDLEAEPDLDLESEPQPELQLQAKSEAQLKLESKLESELELEPEPQPEPQSQFLEQLINLQIGATTFEDDITTLARHLNYFIVPKNTEKSDMDFEESESIKIGTENVIDPIDTDDFNLLIKLFQKNPSEPLRDFIRERIDEGRDFKIFLDGERSSIRLLYEYMTCSNNNEKTTEQRPNEKLLINSNASRSILKSSINSQPEPESLSESDSMFSDFDENFLTSDSEDFSEEDINLSKLTLNQNIFIKEVPVFRHDDINVSETLCKLSKGEPVSSSEMDFSHQRVKTEDIVRHTISDHCYHQLRPMEEDEELIESDEEEEIDVVSYEKKTAHFNFAQLQRNAARHTPLVANSDQTTFRRPRGRPPGRNSAKRKRDVSAHQAAPAPKRSRAQNNQHIRQRYNNNQQNRDLFEDVDKRQLHNTMERERRIGLKKLFENLKDSLPMAQANDKMSKQTILNNARNTILMLTPAFRNHMLKKRLERLQRRLAERVSSQIRNRTNRK